jgi:hypothetical protein
MSTDDQGRPDRRRVMQLGAMVTLFGVAAAGAAQAAASTPKTDVKYQYTPSGASRCGLCASFVPPSDGGPGPGTCKIVVGPIPQNGWCVLYSPK